MLPLTRNHLFFLCSMLCVMNLMKAALYMRGGEAGLLIRWRPTPSHPLVVVAHVGYTDVILTIKTQVVFAYHISLATKIPCLEAISKELMWFGFYPNFMLNPPLESVCLEHNWKDQKKKNLSIFFSFLWLLKQVVLDEWIHLVYVLWVMVSLWPTTTKWLDRPSISSFVLSVQCVCLASYMQLVFPTS